MKNFELKKEIWLWLIMLLPIAYLFYVYNSLPETVPTHFGMDGKPNGWSSKASFICIIPGMLIGIYTLFTVIPFIDPKGRITAMGKKYFMFKLFLMLFMVALSFFMIQSAISKDGGNANMMFVMVGALFAFLGNYMQAVKPNYFIGIRTPWTLENEVVWRKTHALGGKLYFIAGLLIMILPFILTNTIFFPVFIGLAVTASVIPIIYSYIAFRQEKKKVL